MHSSKQTVFHVHNMHTTGLQDLDIREREEVVPLTITQDPATEFHTCPDLWLWCISFRASGHLM